MYVKVAVGFVLGLTGAYLVSKMTNKKQTSNKSLVFIGTYTQPAGHIRGDELGKGIYSFELNEDGSLSPLCLTTTLSNPSFLTTSTDGRFLYAVSETSHGMISAYKINRDTGALTLIDAKPSGGADPCHIDYKDSMVVCANYSGGSF
jgi:6-phosphogluconolactonase (cycloisomerase 2 family)